MTCFLTKLKSSTNIAGQRHVHQDLRVPDCIQLFCSSATDTQHSSFR